MIRRGVAGNIDNDSRPYRVGGTNLAKRGLDPRSLGHPYSTYIRRRVSRKNGVDMVHVNGIGGNLRFPLRHSSFTIR